MERDSLTKAESSYRGEGTQFVKVVGSVLVILVPG